MLGYLTIIILVLFSIGIMLDLLFQHYYESEKEKRLISEGKEVSEVISTYLSGEMDLEMMTKTLEDTEHHLNAEIVIFNKNGQFYNDLRPYEHSVNNDPFTSEEWNQVMLGQVVTKENRNNNKLPLLSVALPLRSNEEIIGGLSLHSAVFDIQNSMKQVQKFIVIAGMIALFISTFLTYLLSNRITSPLKKMNKAALDLATGKTTNSIQTTGEDEIAQLTQTFNYMVDELNKTEQMRRDFIANVSHELRSPLAYISGVLQLLSEGKLSGPISINNHVEPALARAKSMSRLIDDLLDLSKMEADTFQLKRSKIDINEIIRRVLAQLEPNFKNKGLDIDAQIGESTIFVSADHGRIEQVLVNLLDNATKYSPRGSVIQIKSQLVSNKVQLEITDSGPGINPEELPMIWERFYKVDKVRTPDGTINGTGLGLAIVKHLIHAHGGEVKVDSTLDIGTTFSFVLPLYK